MFLKSLTIKGFKSFADTAALNFEPGVTVVVGPNGSGKSNVVDAVAWVLGAQGPRTVRSSKMEDVIFAGSADRPALGRAEVSLTIDNRAGRLPGGLAEITITRTLFRSGDSEYALNGQPCRLLDIQELLSDSGVGRQQHVIVSQGQLDQILNARPEDRRSVVEEAAGVLKHRRRRERSERRLAATDDNLERLGDLLREVRRQMRPLERQAAAARSHAAVSEELRTLRLYLVGQELETLDLHRIAAQTERVGLVTEESRLRQELATLEAASDQATSKLSVQSSQDLVGVITRAQALVERCRGLGAVLTERRRSLDQALEAAAGVDVVSSLESDAARLAHELEQALSAEDVAAPEHEHARSRQSDLAGALAKIQAGDDDELSALRRALEQARARSTDAQARNEEARRCLGACEARAAALAEASHQAMAASTTTELSELSGVLGSISDLVEVDSGWETAFEAALGAALHAVVVEGNDAARIAIERLRSRQVAGRVVSTEAATNRRPLSPHDIGDENEPLRAHVRGRRGDLDSLLDALVGTAVVVAGDWRRALDVHIRRPELTVVTREGDRFSPSGWVPLAGGEMAARRSLAERAERDVQEARAGAERSEVQLRRASEDFDLAARRVDDRSEELKQRIGALQGQLAEATERSQEISTRLAALSERKAVLEHRLREVERRLEGSTAQRQQAGDRRRRIEAYITAVERLNGEVDVHEKRLQSVAKALLETRSRQMDEVRLQSERLETLRSQRHQAEQSLSYAQQRLSEIQVDLAASSVRYEAAAEALHRELGCATEEARQAPCPDLPDGIDAKSRADSLQAQLQSLGPVNPLALQELSALEERHRFLEEQIDDVRRARRELQQLIREVDDEIIRIFAEAFADVNNHFQVLVSTLFPGGTGHLTLTDPSNLLETGVEVEARPAGKNVRKLSLLSGGERSLVALAFLFAVFRSRPSPFYLMDEVEAALDDVNLHRFLDLLHEFRDEAQLIIVSHQKRTMEAADALYGVTMTPGGSSKVVSQKVSGPQQQAAAAPAGA